MSWTTPRTWTATEVVTAAEMNTHIRDNLNDLNIRSTLVSATVSTSESTASTTFTDLATVGPAVTTTVGTSGLILVILTSHVAVDTAGGFATMGVAVSGATTVATNEAYAVTYQAYAINAAHQGSAVFPLVVNPGSNTFTAKYHSTGGATATFAARSITVVPLGS